MAIVLKENDRQTLFWLIATVGMHVLLYPWLKVQNSITGEELYYQKYLFVNAPRVWISFLVCLSLSLFLHKKSIRLELDRKITWLTRILLLALTWNFLFYDYNFYFNQWHVADRLFLGFTAILALWFPLFIIPALMQVNLLHHQFDFPIGTLSFLDKSLPYELLAVCGSFHLLQAVVVLYARYLPARSFFISPPPHLLTWIILVVSGACYYHSGLAKAGISPHGWEWAFENHITNNITAMFNRGWLASFKGLQHLVFTFYQSIEIPAQVFIFLGELACVTLLFNRQVSQWLIVLMFALHLGVFLMNGAFFWIWMAADIGLILLLRKSSVRLDWRSGLAGIILIHFAPLLIKVPTLGWFDSPLDNRFELYANGDMPLSEGALAPYTRHFQHGAFLGVVEGKTLNAGFLVFDYALLQRIKEQHRYSWLTFIEQEGVYRFNEQSRRGMDSLLTRFLRNHRPNPVKILQPPAYWNAHLTSGKETIPGNRVDSLSLYNWYEWNRDNETEMIRGEVVVKVSR